MKNEDKEYYQEQWQIIKEKVMMEWDVYEDDMSDDSIEGDVNRETDIRFEDEFGIESFEILIFN